MTLVDVEMLLLHHAVAYRRPETLIVGPQCCLELDIIVERHGVVCLRVPEMSQASDRLVRSRVVATRPTDDGTETVACDGEDLAAWIEQNPEACAVFTRIRNEVVIPDRD